MSTANFKSMKNFDLWAISNSAFYVRYCKDCHTENNPDALTCDYCGADLSEKEPEYSQFFAEDFYNDLDAACQTINDKLHFHYISVISGYYDGLQIYVNLSWDADNAGFTENGPEYLDNDSAHYYYSVCRSVCIRKYEAEIKRINRQLEKLGREYGLDKLGILGRFSNGEVVYTKMEV